MATDEISVGDWVVAGRGEDLDVGRIVSLACGKETMGEGDAIGGDVAWEWSQTRTYSPIGGQNDVAVYGTREAAIEEAERRKANVVLMRNRDGDVIGGIAVKGRGA